jgi:hypothetical protein
MRNDSIETLLLRHYGSTAPAPVDLERQLSAAVRQEAATMQVRQVSASTWNQRRVSRRRVLQLVTFTGGAGTTVLTVGASSLRNVFASHERPSLSL